ncbi:MAG: protein kinase [Candidatus Eremiobacterota bacterium]
MCDLYGKRYRVIEKIGTGSMGYVLKCHDIWLGRNVALKIPWSHLIEHDKVSSAIKPLKRFFREARELACLDHPNIITIYDIGSENNIPYIVMPFIEGKTLDKILSCGKPDTEKALAIAIDIFEAIGYAHTHGIVHRDLKPSNIIITESGKTMVMDFGMVRRTGSNTELTEINSIIGTADYISPEQAMSSRVDRRADLYSIGIILYELFTGVKPFRGDNIFALILQHINVIPQPPSFHNPFINMELEKIIINLLQKNPEKRCDNTKKILSVLKNILACNEKPGKRLYKERNIDFNIRLIGKDTTIYRLVCLADMVRSGKNFVCSVIGPEGTGKSRLVNEIITIASVRKIKCLKEELGEIDRVIPFYSTRKLIKELNLEDVIHNNRDITLNDFSSLITDKLKDYTNSEPLIIIFDDVCYATDDTKTLLASVIKKSILENIPVLWVLTSHIAEKTFYDRDLYRAGKIEDIKLEYLSHREFSELIEEALGKNRLSNEAIDKIYMLCNGSPLYLREIIKEPRKIYPEKNRKDIIKSNIENLKNNPLLQLLCVYHEDLSSSEAEQILKIHPKKILKEFSLPDIVKYNKNNDTFSFIHPLYKNTLYDNITSDIKNDLHSKITCLYKEKLKNDKKGNFSLLCVLLYHLFKGEDIEQACYYCKKNNFLLLPQDPVMYHEILANGVNHFVKKGEIQ